MAWFKVSKVSKDERAEKKVAMPEGLWIKCNNCGEIIYKKEVARNLSVCPKCNYHFRLSAQERISLLADRDSFVEFDESMEAGDPLEFKDSKKYTDRVKSAQNSSGLKDALVYGDASINGAEVVLAVFDFAFMGGSMGSVVGEKITRAIERGIEKNIPVIVVSSSGGARMQEGILSLMQMAKTSAALARLRSSGLPYISVLTDPTTGGVTASFAMLGDVIVAEPKALICFAGPRVIEQTIKQTLPEGFQRSEYLLEHGMVDLIVERKDMKDTIGKILSMLVPSK